jgi:type IV pilus assembly protein PilA
LDGVHYHSFLMPSRSKPVQIVYAFVDGYLLISSGRDVAASSVALRKSGDSLAKSKALLASIPPGHGSEASAVFYEDATAMMGLQARQLTPELANAVTSHLPTQSIPITSWAYGEDTAIRGVSASGGADVTGILIGAAIAIPNLLRARIAANESSAAGTIRTINVAQITYAMTYPQRGFARDLAMLGPNPGGPDATSPQRASLIDLPLGDSACTAGEWCTKSGYRFTLKALCKENGCKEYVVLGTPESLNTGNRSFCSTSDALVRIHVGPVLTAPITVGECRKWPPLQ